MVSTLAGPSTCNMQCGVIFSWALGTLVLAPQPSVICWTRTMGSSSLMAATVATGRTTNTTSCNLCSNFSEGTTWCTMSRITAFRKLLYRAPSWRSPSWCHICHLQTCMPGRHIKAASHSGPCALVVQYKFLHKNSATTFSQNRTQNTDKHHPPWHAKVINNVVLLTCVITCKVCLNHQQWP